MLSTALLIMTKSRRSSEDDSGEGLATVKMTASEVENTALQMARGKNKAVANMASVDKQETALSS